MLENLCTNQLPSEFKTKKYTNIDVYSVLCVDKKRELSFENSLSVIQLGLEPRTPSLKGMCSTC